MSNEGGKCELYGYHGKILRVELTKGRLKNEPIDESILRKYVGGSGLGIKFIYDEVPPSAEWNSPNNLLFLGSGPLGGTTIGGSGTICGVTKGALTGGIGCSQANGFFGAYLRSSGFDGIVIQGAASSWVYLHIREDGTAELRDASHLRNKDTYEVDDMIKEDLEKKEREASVLAIGPAGENLVRFACISTDKGHMIAHNGFGAVMGSKKLKAIVVDRGKQSIPIKDKGRLSQLAKEIRQYALEEGGYKAYSEWGTLWGVHAIDKAGGLPVKNYTTSIYQIEPNKFQEYSSEKIRTKFKEVKKRPCWGCGYHHCSLMQIPEGKYAGHIIEEPEYESLASWSSQVGITEIVKTVELASIVDRLGLDTNESCWVIGWLIECYEKGLLGAQDTGGLVMEWGNSEAIEAMLTKIAKREGFGDILAEGVMRASQRIGRGTENMGIYTKKGNTPRSHDHRVLWGWLELFDTCVSNTGTLETQFGAPFKILGISPLQHYDPMSISTVEAKIKGAMIFEDCMGTCRFNSATNPDLLAKAVNAATGWNMTMDDAMIVGLRSVNLARAYNLRCGIRGELDAPSIRYGSTPLDGPLAGKGIMPHWDEMLRNYYQLMGWDEKGRPLPETLRSLGLEDVVPDLW